MLGATTVFAVLFGNGGKNSSGIGIGLSGPLQFGGVPVVGGWHLQFGYEPIVPSGHLFGPYGVKSAALINTPTTMILTRKCCYGIYYMITVVKYEVY